MPSTTNMHNGIVTSILGMASITPYLAHVFYYVHSCLQSHHKLIHKSLLVQRTDLSTKIITYLCYVQAIHDSVCPQSTCNLC